MKQFLQKHRRSHTCNELSAANIGEQVVLCGWVQSMRDHGGRRFIDLRDRYGVTQIVFKPETDVAFHSQAHELRPEWCIGIVGLVEDRVVNGGAPNERLLTGHIEVDVKELHVFSHSEVPPFEIQDNIDTNEEKRLTHRTLDLRRPEMQKNFILRHRISQLVRNFFDANNFLEIETPAMVKYTPGGARNFLVPSRMHPGSFFALAESPQLFKQMFMMAGFDRYFQIVKCFRDEDLRGDRQPEFTQIDLEMSFITEEVIQGLIQKLIVQVFSETLGVQLKEPFDRMTYAEVMDKYGSDKPDRRFGLELINLTTVINENKGAGISLFEATLKDGGIIKAIKLDAKHALSRTEIDKLEEVVKQLGGGGLGRAKVSGDTWTQSPFVKTAHPDAIRAINQACQAEEGDVLLFQFGKAKLVNSVLSGLRLHLAKLLKLLEGKPHIWNVLWVTDFPLFEYDEGKKVYMAAHHPFTSPQQGHVKKLESDPGSCLARAYDLVINGNEIGGGSIRNHEQRNQELVFDALGISKKEQQQKFGFLLEAMKYGAPPHGGIALGLDRLCMLMAGGKSIRDVIAFPKTQRGVDLLTLAPGAVDEEQLRELHIMSVAPAKHK